MTISVPELSLVLLVGASGSGKSSFARRHFRATEVVSSDTCRGLVSDDENSQEATADAFELLQFLVAKRLARGRLTVVDATSVRPEDRARLVAIAREYHVLPCAIVLDLPPRICEARNRERPDRAYAGHYVRNQVRALRASLRGLRGEGFRHVTVLTSPEEIEEATVERHKLWTNRRELHGPFDVIGDVHGCHDELRALLARLGYVFEGPPEAPVARHPEGRTAIFLGDLVDRGPDSPGVLRLVMGMVAAGTALAVPGNHDVKLMKALLGRDVKTTHGLAETLAQLAAVPEEERAAVARFLDGLVSHYVLDEGRLVVAHAGLKEDLQGRASARVREFALYGETTGENDEFGLPVRVDWTAEYRGGATVVYGHTPTLEPAWTNRTVCVDTGCVFGGSLTALRYPERELVSVSALRTWYEPRRPLGPPPEAAPAPARAHADLLDITDVLGKRTIATRLRGNITIPEENSIAALEAMSRFAVDPRWLVYLPPTMAPPDTCKDGDYLEHPIQAFEEYLREGVARVVCEEKHMGSRAAIVLARDATAARRRFGVADGTVGVVYTRTGRRFFAEAADETAILARVGAAMERSGLWERLASDWVVLDVEILPWSAKAQELLRLQYAPAGTAARHGSAAAVAALAAARARTSDDGDDTAALLARYEAREVAVGRFVDAYRRYCWPVVALTDYKIAPFHLLASEGHVHVDRDHVWHMETLAELCRADEALLRATPYRVVELTDPESAAAGIAWWEALTGAGGEGMVVKPFEWLARGRRGLAQPAVKCRGREYLRIIYGPEYTAPEHLDRLRARGLSVKRSLALRELALGLEALHRFVEGEPLYRVHEAVFGVLALESEPVDPRL